MTTTPQIRKILVPTDFSDDAARALQRATDLARTFGAELHLLHAFQMLMTIGPTGPIALPQEYFDQIRREAQAQLDRLREKAAAEGVSRVSTLLSHDSPAAAIVDTAAQIGADLIVMGTRGRTGMKHVLLGSVAERVVRLAPCDVLTVKAPHAEEA
jgi:universal stress protein A